MVVEMELMVARRGHMTWGEVRWGMGEVGWGSGLGIPFALFFFESKKS